MKIETGVSDLDEKFSRLSPEYQGKVILFITLMTGCPDFMAELRTAAPEGRPSWEVVEALMEKYKGRLSA